MTARYRSYATAETPEDRVLLVQTVVSLLGEARNAATAAGCQRLTPKIRRALKSAEGAERHALGRVLRPPRVSRRGAQ